MILDIVFVVRVQNEGTCGVHLVSIITITVPDELRRAMRRIKRIIWNSVARRMFQETIYREEMREAAHGIDRLRSSDRTHGWSGAKEIRRWRDETRSS